MTTTTRYTQEEWLAVFDQVEQDLNNKPPSIPSRYEAPGVGTSAFAKTIDHTLLKLEATGGQVDSLCEEARRFDFQVCFFSY